MISWLGWIFGAAAVAMVAFLVGSGVLAPGMTYQAEIIAAATQVLTSLLVVTLLVERAMGVLNALLFGEKQRAAELEHLYAVAPAQKAQAVRAMADVLAVKERLRLLLGFGAGLFVAAAGVRTLGPLFSSAPPHPQLFQAVDAVLTAGLIAGGGNGLAFLLQLLKDRFATAGAPAAPVTPVVPVVPFPTTPAETEDSESRVTESLAPVAPIAPLVPLASAQPLTTAQVRALMMTTS